MPAQKHRRSYCGIDVIFRKTLQFIHAIVQPWLATWKPSVGHLHLNKLSCCTEYAATSWSWHIQEIGSIYPRRNL
jgi:hypothetical protein